ncbi:MAG: hypothetical protein ACLQOO_03770 [Terriglobia bacterium]
MKTVNGTGITLYGYAKRQPLSGREAREAEEHGYFPYTYQAQKWLVILWLPILPLGTYRVLRMKGGGGVHTIYRMTQIKTDVKQILFHYLVVYGTIALLVALAWLMSLTL